MRIIGSVVVLVGTVLPMLARAQATPVSDAYRQMLSRQAKNLVASAEEMPADKYGYKPTAAQMTFGEVILHIAGDNDEACAPVGGMQAPKRAALAPTDEKAKLVARLRESFASCDQAAAKVNDSDLNAEVSAFGDQWTRAALMDERMEDWADHYSQLAIYLRLNGLLPPTARRS
ncbi:MAG TPA: DinB family protein [Gemmatimonadaceae bacterium]|nr:DinB family protein [Gemmatimonadaceae bacterium]